MVLAQYYNLVRYGRAGYAYIMKNMQQNARCWPRSWSPWAGSS